MRLIFFHLDLQVAHVIFHKIQWANFCTSEQKHCSSDGRAADCGTWGIVRDPNMDSMRQASKSNKISNYSCD